MITTMLRLHDGGQEQTLRLRGIKPPFFNIFRLPQHQDNEPNQREDVKDARLWENA